MAAQKTASLHGALRGRHGRVFPRVPIFGAMIGYYRPELLLVLDPRAIVDSSCRIMVDTSVRIRGVNWKESYPSADDPTLFLYGWHEHRWQAQRGDSEHHPIAELGDVNTFREVLSWAQLRWNLDIEGMELIHPALIGM